MSDRTHAMFITKKHLSRRTVLAAAASRSRCRCSTRWFPRATRSRRPRRRRSRARVHLLSARRDHGQVDAGRRTGAELRASRDPEAARAVHASTSTVVSGLGNKPGESRRRARDHAGHVALLRAPERSARSRTVASPRPDRRAAHRPGHAVAVARDRHRRAGGGGACERGYGCSYSSTLSFRTPTTPLPMEHNPRKLFQQLFGAGRHAGASAARSRSRHAACSTWCGEANALRADARCRATARRSTTISTPCARSSAACR